ncbi:MAG: tetratricopeptide repeat protein [Bacteroidota bacterium]
MFRSPIFILLLLFLFYSCNEVNKPISKTEKKSPATTEAKKLLNLGETYNSKQKFDSAFYYYNRSKIVFEIQKDSASVTYNLIVMATIQQISGDYFGSEKNLLEALKFVERNSLYETAIYNSLGISSKELMNYDDALYYYNKAKLTNNQGLSQVMIDNNIAGVYIQKKRYATAVNILKSVLESNILDTLDIPKARALDNLGYAYSKINTTPQALELMNKALSIRKKNTDSFGLIGSYLHLSDYYLKIEPQKAKACATEAYQLSIITKSITERIEALAFLVSNNFDTPQNNYTLEYIKLNDSVTKARNQSKNQFAKIKYDSDYNRTENLKLNNQKIKTALELEEKKNNIQLLIFIVFTSIGLGIFVFIYLNLKNKRDKIKTIYVTETRISKQLHDELANDVYHAMTFAETQDLATENNKEILLSNLDNIYSRTRNISKENSFIDTGSNYVLHLKEMMANFGNDNVNVLINGLEILPTTTLENHKKIMVYRIIQELLVNMKKHSQCSLVVITFKKIDKKIQIEYSDNGIGTTLDKINLKNGLQNVENRIDAIKGTITFDNTTNKGFKVSFSFPI